MGGLKAHRHVDITVTGAAAGEVLLGFDAADPHAVLARFTGPGYDASWAFDRAQLQAALKALAPVGAGNVTVSRIKDKVRLDLYRRGTHGTVMFSAFELEAFLSLTAALCPPGSAEEARAVDLQVDVAISGCLAVTS